MRNYGKELREISKNLRRSLRFVETFFEQNETKILRGTLKKILPETNWRIIVLAKNDLFKSSVAISAGIFIEISTTTIFVDLCKRIFQGKFAGKFLLMRKPKKDYNKTMQPNRSKNRTFLNIIDFCPIYGG